MNVNPYSVRYVKTPGNVYTVWAFDGRTMSEVFIGVVKKDPRGWILQPREEPTDWIGFYTTRAEAADSLVWRANRVPA